MYSGSDSNESQKFPQWALNPATYQNLSNEQVDWAALAQQWIIMKESGPPPIPGEQTVIIKKLPEKHLAKEVHDESTAPPAPVWNVNEPPPAPGSEAWGNYSQNPNWNWNSSWAPPAVVPPPPSINVAKPALLPTPTNSYNAPPESNSDNAVPFGSYNTSANESNHSSYWTSSSGHKHIKPHNKRYSKVNVPIRATAPLPQVIVEPEASPITPMPSLDANKRKQLPAWIREGLEKMEKDKLRQMEKEKQKQEREENLEKNIQTDKETIEILRSTMKERNKSRFDSDEENSIEESKPQRRLSVPEPIPLTPDELMLKVRRTMTEILLTVTNRHIEAVCREELQRFAKKRKAADQRSSAPSGANISSRLGLGVYADDSASDSEDEQEDAEQHGSLDSDDDLKDTIKRKMSEFQKTEQAIENRLDEVERKKAEGVTRSPTPETNDNDSQVDARSQGTNQHKEDKVAILPPKSTTPKQVRSSSTSSEASEHSDVRSRRRSRSSSSESNDSYRKSKKNRRRSFSSDKRRRSRSTTPSKRRDSNGSKRASTGSRRRSSRRSRSRSSSYYRSSRRSRSRDRSRRSRSRSKGRSRYSKRSPSSSRSNRRRRRSRSESSGRGKRSHRH